jgi:dipeptidyl aminopeptidase/acylaminoacyl peptidase
VLGDRRFSNSPDGSNLAFIRYEHSGVADIYVLPMAGGRPRRLTNWNDGEFGGLAWIPNGREIIYSKRQLWRISVDLAQPGRGTPIGSIWWSVAGAGVFFIKREAGFDAIDRYNLNDHKVVRLGRLAQRAAPVSSQLNVSRDGRWALIAQEQIQTDLMLVENFKRALAYASLSDKSMLRLFRPGPAAGVAPGGNG